MRLLGFNERLKKKQGQGPLSSGSAEEGDPSLWPSLRTRGGIEKVPGLLSLLKESSNKVIT